MLNWLPRIGLGTEGKQFPAGALRRDGTCYQLSPTNGSGQKADDAGVTAHFRDSDSPAIA
jgi:hypothetical protein